MKRHIGFIAKQDQRCVIVYMQLPERLDKALVITTDSLPPRYEDALMSVLETKEAQTTSNLAEVLGRRIFPDTGENILQAFHSRGLLRSVPIGRVMLTPTPSQHYCLVDVLRDMGRLPADYAGIKDGVYGYTLPSSEVVGSVEQPAEAISESLNHPGSDIPPASNAPTESPAEIAKGLLLQAEMLEEEATSKRNQAYALDPTLNQHVKLEEVEQVSETERGLEPVSNEGERDVKVEVEDSAEIASAVDSTIEEASPLDVSESAEFNETERGFEQHTASASGN